MPQISVTVSDDILISLNETEYELAQRMKLYTALELFKSHKLTLVQSSNLAGVPIDEFMGVCGKHDIPVINYDATELEAELKRFS